MGAIAAIDLPLYAGAGDACEAAAATHVLAAFAAKMLLCITRAFYSRL